MKSEDPVERAAELPSGEQPIRAAEVVGALSLATDLGTGQPLEHALRTAALAVRLDELADGASFEFGRYKISQAGSCLAVLDMAESGEYLQTVINITG